MISLTGLDIAFVKNGYVYHTRYDDAKSIPDGSIQRAGDNVLGIVNGIANSPYLEVRAFQFSAIRVIQ